MVSTLLETGPIFLIYGLGSENMNYTIIKKTQKLRLSAILIQNPVKIEKVLPVKK
jgi:hypothetical protein